MPLNKIVFISFSSARGGAAKAAVRFYAIARKITAVRFISIEESPRNLYWAWHYVKRLISFSFIAIFQKKGGVKCSTNFFSFRPAAEALSEPKQLIHIQWINNDTISIFDLKKIPYASILTLHDEWFYCGVEHYFDINNIFKSSPYCYDNDRGLKRFISPVHKFVWNIKRKALADRKDLIVTCPSKWLAERAKNSHVLQNCDIRVLYNPIDISVFSKAGKDSLDIISADFDLSDRLLILFGAVRGTKNQLKGFAELSAALKLLGNNSALRSKIVLGLFGAHERGLKELHGFQALEFGYIRDDHKMAEIYSLAYMTIVPSRLEAFGQIAAESQSCETPVIAFDTSGLKDVVIDGKTGFLAEPFYPKSLAGKIEHLLSLSSVNYMKLCKGAREHVVENFSSAVVARQYESIINEQHLKKQR